MSAWRKSLALTLLLALCVAARAQAAGAAPLVGAPLPAYAATSLQGEAVSPASLQGHVVLLNVWATWCSPCRQEIPYLASLHEQQSTHGLRVVGVSIDSEADRAQVIDLARSLPIPYAIWLDPEERIGGLLRSSGVPATLLIDRAGIVRWRHIGILREGTPGFREALAAALEGEAR